MTDEQIDALQAGPEMDRAVAAAIGYTIEAGENYAPSMRWDDAMLAAEAFGLFDGWSEWDGIFCLYRDKPAIPSDAEYRWHIADIIHIDESTGGHQQLVEDASGPLAICRAILKLARDKA